MAEILRIDSNKVKIGTDDEKIITVPIASINYPNPQVGDQVKAYKDGDAYIVQKVAGISEKIYSDDNEKKKINKHIFVWVCNFLFGGIGVDRFIRGQIGTGICKLLFGWLTLGIWPLVDWIISMVKAYGGAYGSEEQLTFDTAGHYLK
jgi:TM2 domain-containing membrane protein YozV